jgi:lipopolysaccharide export system permease protein
MLNLLDRQLVRSYLKAYLVCLVSLLALFIVVDLFNNLDDFTAQNRDLGGILLHIARYYGYKTAQIFDRLCEAIVLLAAMFTVAWMQRNNELLPVLSAGVSTRRVVLPVLLTACAMLGLSVLNQELVLPQVDRYVVENREDARGDKEIDVTGGWESNKIHITGSKAVRRERLVRDFICTIPAEIGQGNLSTLQAREARYYPPGPGPHSGGWMLSGTQPAVLENWHRPEILKMIVEGKFFLKTEQVDFDLVTRPKNWHMFVPTWRLRGEMDKTDASRLADVAVIFHMRWTRPLLGIILVLLGLAIILRDQNRNVFVSAGLCLVLCAVFFAACYGCKYLGDADYLRPALAAWLPVLTFGPPALVLFDAVHT